MKTEKDVSFDAFHLEIFRNDLYQQNKVSTLSSNVQRGIEHDQLSTVITVEHDCITIEHDCVTIEHNFITMRHDLALITEE